MLADVLTGVTPAHPPSADYIGSLAFPMNGNDKIGDCFPVSVANDAIATSAFCGQLIAPSLNDVIDLYSRISKYDPKTGAHDDGCVMQLGLEELARNGIGDGRGGVVKPVAFAKAIAADTDTIESGISVLGGSQFGVDLQTAQQAQTSVKPPVWDYRRSSDWGGHAIYAGAFEPDAPKDIDVISWMLRVKTTEAFRQHQLGEVWFIVWPWHLSHPAFQAGIDLALLAAEYTALTGKVLPVPAPSPVPSPGPVAPADRDLWAAVGGWVAGHHTGSTTKPVAVALKAWARAKGLSG